MLILFYLHIPVAHVVAEYYGAGNDTFCAIYDHINFLYRLDVLCVCVRYLIIVTLV